jgi:hypothetical protein
MSKRFLEPDQYHAGYVVAGDDDVVEGRFVWNDAGGQVGTPYDVVVDGKRLSWEELGRALGLYEGWRFRIELSGRVDDLRAGATVVPLPSA